MVLVFDTIDNKTHTYINILNTLNINVPVFFHSKITTRHSWDTMTFKLSSLKYLASYSYLYAVRFTSSKLHFSIYMLSFFTFLLNYFMITTYYSIWLLYFRNIILLTNLLSITLTLSFFSLSVFCDISCFLYCWIY